MRKMCAIAAIKRNRNENVETREKRPLLMHLKNILNASGRLLGAAAAAAAAGEQHCSKVRHIA